MLKLQGYLGIGHVRYPSASSNNLAEAQPFYTNTPYNHQFIIRYGIALAQNGCLTSLSSPIDPKDFGFRHVNTDSDAEFILNLFANDVLLSIEKSVLIS